VASVAGSRKNLSNFSFSKGNNRSIDPNGGKTACLPSDIGLDERHLSAKRRQKNKAVFAIRYTSHPA
jgi:hypothetical protein